MNASLALPLPTAIYRRTKSQNEKKNILVVRVSFGVGKRGNATPHVCKKGVELPIANEKKG